MTGDIAGPGSGTAVQCHFQGRCLSNRSTSLTLQESIGPVRTRILPSHLPWHLQCLAEQEQGGYVLNRWGNNDFPQDFGLTPLYAEKTLFPSVAWFLFVRFLCFRVRMDAS